MANSNDRCKPQRTTMMVGWIPPTFNYIKINVDGSSSTGGSAAIGGIIRDTNGEWILGFNKHLGGGNALLAEMWSIHYGLEIAWKFGYNCVELECDSLGAVKLLTDPTQASHPLHSLTTSCKEALNRN